MHYIRAFCSVFGALLACAVQADTIPTLTATYAHLNWDTTSGTYSSINGADFSFSIPYSTPYGTVTYPCSLPLPPGGCVAPGPQLFFQEPSPNPYVEGFVTLNGVQYSALFAGNAQIQYLTPTITYPDPTAYPPPANSVEIPVVLSGSETAYLGMFPNLTPAVNISINLPGTLRLYAVAVSPGFVTPVESLFDSTPVPEPGSVALACLGFLALVAANCKTRGRI